MFGLKPYERYNTLGDYDIFKEMEDFGKNFWQYGKADFKTDIIDNGKEYVLEAELPGFKKDEINVELDDGYLTISAEKSLDKDEEKKHGRYIRRERYAGAMQRRFYVGDALTQDDIKAKYEHGILKLSVPKKEAQAVESSSHIAIEG